jgi:hypothetical protein
VDVLKSPQFAAACWQEAADTPLPQVTVGSRSSPKTIEDPPRHSAQPALVPFRQRLKTTAYVLIAAATFGLAVFTATTTGAAGNDADQSFLRKISNLGIGFTASERVIATAHDVCHGLDKGQSGSAARQKILNRTHLTQSQATHFLTAAVTSYCPQFSSEIPAA